MVVAVVAKVRAECFGDAQPAEGQQRDQGRRARGVRGRGCQQSAQLVSGQADGLGVIGHLGAPDGGDGGVGQHLGVMDAEVIEARQRRELAGNRGRRCRAPGAWLGLGGQVTHPQVDVMALSGLGMHAEAGAPRRPRLQVAAIGGGGVGAVANEPRGGEAHERIVCR
jgi:hypothetical protein